MSDVQREAFEKWYLGEHGMNPNGIGLNHDERKHASSSKKAYQAGWQACAEANKLEIERLREALERIANVDYRGNRSEESVIAYKAINKYKPKANNET